MTGGRRRRADMIICKRGCQGGGRVKNNDKDERERGEDKSRRRGDGDKIPDGILQSAGYGRA